MESTEHLLRLQQHQIAQVLTFAAALARRMGLTVSEMAALEHLHAAEDGLTPTQLGQRLSMGSGTVTPLVDRLERAGYVHRRPNPADRRSSIIGLTSWGEQDAGRHLMPLAADLLHIAEGLGPQQQEVVAHYLEAVSAALGDHAASPASA